MTLSNRSVATAVLAAVCSFGASNQGAEAVKRVQEANEVVKEIMSGKDAGIPEGARSLRGHRAKSQTGRIHCRREIWQGGCHVP